MNAIRVGVVAAVVLAHLLLSFVVVWVVGVADMPAPEVALAWCLGQASLVAFVAVCGGAPIVVRWPGGLLLATVLWFSLALGTSVIPRDGGSPWNFLITTRIAKFVGVAVVVSSIPFWLLRTRRGWRLTAEASTTAGSARNTQFRLGELLAGSLMLAMSVGLVAAILRVDSEGDVPAAWELPLGAAIAFANVAVVLPSIRWSFAPYRGMLQQLPTGLGYLFLITLGQFIVLRSLLFPPQVRLFLALLLYNFLLCLCVAGTLAVLRSVGIRLERGFVSPLDERVDVDV